MNRSESNKYPLKDKTIILTGASHGIGRALAPLLASRGTQLVLNARGGTALDEAAAECRIVAPVLQMRAVAGDIAESAVVRQLVAEAKQLGSFYGLIHAAAVFEPGPFLWELEPEQFQSIFASNVFGLYQLARFVVPALLPLHEGLMVIFGSGAAYKVQPGIAAYSAAKVAEELLARHLAQEAPEITTFVFRPGIVETRMQKQAREATGGAASQIHSVFRPWKEKGRLLTPQVSAARLIEILEEGPRRYHGEIEESMEIRSVGKRAELPMAKQERLDRIRD
jgi:NAD(P)-dependent dehydrogenase (short-subunit alcohol dehydrogenase family)